MSRVVFYESSQTSCLKNLGWIIKFTLPYDLGTSAIFLVDVAPDAAVTLGYDPEEVHLEHKMLEDVAWFPVEDLHDHPEVQRVLACIDEWAHEDGIHFYTAILMVW